MEHIILMLCSGRINAILKPSCKALSYTEAKTKRHMLAGIDSNNNRSNPTGIDGTRGNLRETPCSIISARSNYRTHAERTADNRQPF
ncbi:Protein BIR1 [Dissostichus eleginoides]|uniref:Protein BIR1 n=1 Tax=Dissostichus eleginoides TaxID=100907 RepID=A0AAD9BDA7_DISEL|nr:Protein BIR1 [Dissostichus eleginoides]